MTYELLIAAFVTSVFLSSLTYLGCRNLRKTEHFLFFLLNFTVLFGFLYLINEL